MAFTLYAFIFSIPILLAFSIRCRPSIKLKLFGAISANITGSDNSLWHILFIYRNKRTFLHQYLQGSLNKFLHFSNVEHEYTIRTEFVAIHYRLKLSSTSNFFNGFWFITGINDV
jgi:hypothetical protein